MNPEIEINPILHQPIRTKIVAYLASMNEVDFSTLKKVLHLTDGHMSTHMKTLMEENYVEVKKEFVNQKPKTTYRLTAGGRQAFQQYLETLKKLVSGM